MHIIAANKADRSPCFLFFKKYIFSCCVIYIFFNFNKVMELVTAVDNKNIFSLQF